MTVMIVALVITWVMIAMMAWAILALARQIGVLHERLAPVGALTTGLLFALHGAVFLSLKTGGEVREDAMRTGRLLLAPTALVVGGFGL